VSSSYSSVPAHSRGARISRSTFVRARGSSCCHHRRGAKRWKRSCTAERAARHSGHRLLRNLALVAGSAPVDLEGVLHALSPQQGMLYYHLLLARLETRNDLGRASGPVKRFFRETDLR
jgi:hypothetical protein